MGATARASWGTRSPCIIGNEGESDPCVTTVRWNVSGGVPRKAPRDALSHAQLSFQPIVEVASALAIGSRFSFGVTCQRLSEGS